MSVIIVVGVTLLQRRGRLGDPTHRVGLEGYGPVLAAACSGSAAAVHLAVVGEHAARAVAAGSTDAFALLYYACVGTGLGVAAVGVFTIAGYFLAHALH